MSVSLLCSKLFPTHSCCLSLSHSGWQDIPVHLSLLQTLLAPFTCCCFWSSCAVPIGLGAECLCSPQFIPTADSISSQTAMMDCALETGVGYIPPLTEFIITVFDLLFLSFIFHLNKSSFPLSPHSLALFSKIPSLSSLKVPHSSKTPFLLPLSPALVVSTCCSPSWCCLSIPPLMWAPLPLWLEGMFTHTFSRFCTKVVLRFCLCGSGVLSLSDSCVYSCENILRIALSNRNLLCCIHSTQRTETL